MRDLLSPSTSAGVDSDCVMGHVERANEHSLGLLPGVERSQIVAESCQKSQDSSSENTTADGSTFLADSTGNYSDFVEPVSTKTGGASVGNYREQVDVGDKLAHGDPFPTSAVIGASPSTEVTIEKLPPHRAVSAATETEHLEADSGAQIKPEKVDVAAAEFLSTSKGKNPRANGSLVFADTRTNSPDPMKADMDPLKSQRKFPKLALVGNRRITDEVRLNVIPNIPRDIYKFSAEEVADVEVE